MTTAPSLSTTAGPARGASAESVTRESGLPPGIAGLVLEVARRTRLWKRERAEVALELCAHFRGGLEAGVAEEELIREFGDVREAAALIRPARRRLRPLWWRAWRRTLHATVGLLALCLLLYAVAAARFFLGSPAIKHNYMEELNAVTRATPLEQRGWPLYLEALREFAPVPEAIRVMDVPRRSTEANWAAYSAWIRSHPVGLQRIREAAARPTLGYILSSDLDPELVKIMETNAPEFKHTPQPEVENPLMVGILLPQLGELRKMTRWLAVDAEDAAISGDRARFLADIDAMLGMSDQCSAGPHLITQLVGLAILEHARDTVQARATDAGFLTDDDLARLSHAFVAGARARATLDMAGEAMTVDDVVQRLYSDDGRGDGRFVRSLDLERIYQDFGVPRPRGEMILAAYRPIQSVILPSRRQINALRDQFIARAAADDSLPPWRHQERDADALYERIGASGLYQILPLIASLQGGTTNRPMASAIASRDLALAKRDALLVVIALELHHRRHGAYPATLAELTPTLLPAVPPDPMDGQPLRYKPPAREGGRPLLYSVGADGVDDGGRPPATAKGRNIASQFEPSFRDYRRPSSELAPEVQGRLEEGRGDWVMWPEPEKADR